MKKVIDQYLSTQIIIAVTPYLKLLYILAKIKIMLCILLLYIIYFIDHLTVIEAWYSHTYLNSI